MNVLIRGNTGRLRTWTSFSVSGWVHGSILAWLALSPYRGPRPRSLYEQVIKPNEKRIIWYHVQDRLPDIAPAPGGKDPRPPRAREKFNQTIVAGPADLDRAKQMISMPAPEIHLPKPLPLPNVVAVAPPPRPLKSFTAPAPQPKTAPAPSLPDVPVQATNRQNPAIPLPTPIAPPKAFTPPPPTRLKTMTAAALPDAPSITVDVHDPNPKLTLPDAKAPPRGFAPPPIRRRAESEAAALPDAPDIHAAAGPTPALGLPEVRAPLRGFTPPPTRQSAASEVAALPDAPNVNAAPGAPKASLPLPDPRAPLRSFKAPATSLRTASQPDLPASPSVGSGAHGGTAQASLAIAGLNPVRTPDIPKPPGSHQAGFSAGAKPRPDGGDGGSSGSSMLVVPGLLVQGGAKDKGPALLADAAPTSKGNLIAAARSALAAPPPPPAPPPEPGATRVSSSPDSRLNNRAVYSLAIQMPNVTSFSGSWIVWFAERETQPGTPAGEIRGPVPIRKVDPKYIAAAADERIEGIVRLSAVIRKDGHVDSVVLLHHLDVRLDRSAAEALRKWEFEPALRDGAPMDVDAVFEIPFHLAPRPAK